MFGKFLLIALVCVSVAQVHGDELENAIRNGLNRARGLNENGRRRINAAIRTVDYKSQLIEVKTEDFVQRAIRVQDSSRQSLRNIAAAMEEKAKESNRPESVFQCIRRNEERANNEIETFTNRFRTDMERLRSTKQDNIVTVSRPLNGMEEALRVRYERAVADIQKCQNPRCVNTVVNSFSTYLNSMFATISRVQGQVATILTNFQRDANNYYANSNRQITRVRSAAMRAIRNCYNRGREDPEDFEDLEDSEETEEF